MERNLTKRVIVVGIIMLFVSTSIIPGLSKDTDRQITIGKISVTPPASTSKGTIAISAYAFGRTNLPQHTVLVPAEKATEIYARFQELKTELIVHPYSDHTQLLKTEFTALLADNGLIPASIPHDRYQALLNPPWFEVLREHHHEPSLTRTSMPSAANTVSALLCSISGEGIGVLFPFVLLPRPRILMSWATLEGSTMIGRMLLIGGYTADGSQFGLALGFWGVGLGFAFPYGNVYGFIGYSLFATVTGQDIRSYPPNHAPVVLGTDPEDKAQNVSMSIKELSFSIEDPDGDLMNYQVTTSPDVGHGNGSKKIAGTYTVPLAGLESSTTYSWHLTVSDGTLITSKDYTFTTEILAPVISDPSPYDHAKYVTADLSNLNFNVTDYQGDLISWSVETSPAIGSGSMTGVHDGRYSVPISNLSFLTTYTWFVNATDGTYTNHKKYTFTTAAEGQVGLLPTDDVTILENHPYDLCGGDDHICTRSLSGWEWDSLLRFDLSAIPANATIRYASLQLYYYYNWDGSPGGDQLNIHRITSDWNEETANWATRPTYAPVPTSSSYVPYATGTWMEWNVTVDVQTFLSGGVTNYGWRIVDIQGGNEIAYFRTKEYMDSQPLLLVGYDV